MDTEGALGQHLANTRAGHGSRGPDREPDHVLGESTKLGYNASHSHARDTEPAGRDAP